MATVTLFCQIAFIWGVRKMGAQVRRACAMGAQQTKRIRVTANVDLGLQNWCGFYILRYTTAYTVINYSLDQA